MNIWKHFKKSVIHNERGSWVVTGVVLATASLGMATASAIATGKNAKKQANQVADQAAFDANQKVRSTVRLAASQRASFMQSGISLTGDDDTPNAVVGETYKFGQEDISQIGKNANNNIKNIFAQARSQELSTMANGIMGFAGSMSKLNLGVAKSPSDDMFTSGMNNGLKAGGY